MQARKRFDKGILWLALASSMVLVLSAPRSESPQSGETCRTRFYDQTIRWVVPYAVGGGYDLQSRLIGPFLGEALGGRVVIENVPGVGGTIGLKSIKEALPDGRVIGIVNTAGLLAAQLTGMRAASDPLVDFTILGRIAITRQIWATGARSGLRNLEEMIAASERERVVFGVRDVATGAFISTVVGAHILGIKANVVAGYEGTPQLSLATIRGEVDVLAGNFDSLRTRIETGELRPLLQISDGRVSTHPALDGVPTLGGDQGWAVKRAAQLARPIDSGRADANALATLVAGSRLVVAPPGMDTSTTRCLRQSIAESLGNARLQELAANSNLALSPASAAEAASDIGEVAARLEHFAPIVRDAVRRMRQ